MTRGKRARGQKGKKERIKGKKGMKGRARSFFAIQVRERRQNTFFNFAQRPSFLTVRAFVALLPSFFLFALLPSCLDCYLCRKFHP
jgi:hypothetical protein